MEEKDVMKAVLGAMMADSAMEGKMKKKRKPEDEEKPNGMLIIIGEEEPEDDNPLNKRLKQKAMSK